MDKVVMLQWVEQVLKPYVLEAPLHFVPLLLSDSLLRIRPRLFTKL